jgi:hypothetical protein
MALSKISEELKNRLVSFYDNRDFLIGVMSNVKTDEKRQKMIDFMDKAEEVGDEITSDDLILLSVVLGNKEKKE